MLRTAVLISGTGRTLKNLLDCQRCGQLSEVTFPLIISNNPQAKGLAYASQCNAEEAIIDHRNYNSVEEFSEAIFAKIELCKCDFVVLAGFMRRIILPPAWTNKVINIHPSLIPQFCGQGFYGKRVHQAAVDYGVKISGCTVHFVNNQFDNGPIIVQKTVPVLASDTADTLAARVLKVEFEALPEALELISRNRVRVEGRIVYINRGYS